MKAEMAGREAALRAGRDDWQSSEAITADGGQLEVRPPRSS